jgi:transcriptional regulator with XRE-family HTH domain
MAKLATRPYSRYTQTALELLGQAIRAERISGRMTAEQVALRAGISRSLLQRIEKGDPGCAIGAAFEVAAIVGVPLFADDPADLATLSRASGEKLTLMPKAVRQPRKVVKDDF